MEPAPSFDCARCGRLIGKLATHFLVGESVWCGRCVDRYVSGVVQVCGSRAYMAHRFGLWPAVVGCSHDIVHDAH